MDFLDRQIDNSHLDFTVKFVLDKLGPELVGNTQKIDRVGIEPMEMGGFVSDLYRIRIHFRQNATNPFSCIFKVPTTSKLDGEVKYDNETFKELVEWCFKVHNAECRFYSEAMPLLFSANLPPLPFRLPKLFAFRLCPSKENVAGGFLLMEDLCAQQGNEPKLAQVGLAQGMSKEQIDSSIVGLAQFHALCLCLPPDLVNSFRLEADLNFEDHKLHILDRLMAMEDAAKEFGPKRKELAELYLRSGTIEVDQHKQFGIAPTICHGDFWSNNLFFECGEKGIAGPKLGAIIDWQVVYSGTGINDLLRVFFVCADPEIRRANTKKWLEMYAEEFVKTLSKIGGHQGEEGSRERSLEMIRQMAEFHCEYECGFQIFLLTNVLGGEKDPSKRAKLIRRMGALFDDCCQKEKEMFKFKDE